MSIDRFRQSFAPRRATARILSDQSLVARHAEADEALQAALSGSDSLAGPDAEHLAELRDAVEQLEAEIAEAETPFVFQGIGRQRWLDTVAQHPPSEADRRDGYDFDPRDFPPTALSLSCVEPLLTLDDARWLAEHLDLAEWRKLWEACLEANVGVSARPKSLTATALRRMSAQSSTTAPLEESLAASSSDE